VTEVAEEFIEAVNGANNQG